MPDLVFVTNRTIVQLPATPDNPGGAVVVLEPGLNPVPEVAASDPFMTNLIQASAPQVEQAQADMETAKGVAEANAQAAQTIAEAQAKNLDGKMKAGEEWASKREAAMNDGVPFFEPHPDPVTQQSITLTSPPHVYAAAGFIGKAAPPPEGAGGAPQQQQNERHTERVLPQD